MSSAKKSPKWGKYVNNSIAQIIYIFASFGGLFWTVRTPGMHRATGNDGPGWHKHPSAPGNAPRETYGILIKSAVAQQLRILVKKVTMTFSPLPQTYLDWIEQEIDPIFVVYQHILKHFQKKYIKKYQNFMILDNFECEKITQMRQICK